MSEFLIRQKGESTKERNQLATKEAKEARARGGRKVDGQSRLWQRRRVRMGDRSKEGSSVVRERRKRRSWLFLQKSRGKGSKG
ncbi:hypothetical protein M5K25_019127 [Dendrobium thyrsiflorum]|uniref:Uncharacterized protein n=1 Tax=Dendrobium thyrsiflorum TaxID=117978 RepID=A0ABD0UDW3_DENTH